MNENKHQHEQSQPDQNLIKCSNLKDLKLDKKFKNNFKKKYRFFQFRPIPVSDRSIGAPLVLRPH